MVDGMYRDGFFCPLAKMVMGETAEVLAEQYKITREEQDEFALASQTRAARAIAAGRFDAELVPVTIEGKREPQFFLATSIRLPTRAWRSWGNFRLCSPSPKKRLERSRREILRESPTARRPWS